MTDQIDLHKEARRTKPDFVVYVPHGKESGAVPIDQQNVHIIVTPTQNGTFIATWTQADILHGPQQRIVVAHSYDQGRTWSDPDVIDAPEPGTENIASWSSLVIVPQTGRIYCIYHKNIGLTDFDRGMTGVLAWRFSDDDGMTWSRRFQTFIGRKAIDHPDPSYPSNWVTAGWQAPIVTAHGHVIIPITRWASRHYHDRQDFSAQHHEGCFLRFENILSEPDPSKLTMTTLPLTDQGIQIPNPNEPGYSAAMEPTIQNLDDGRIICLLRTMTGNIYYCVSSDSGETWTEPKILHHVPGGPPILHPNSPCVLTKMTCGLYLLFHHNNDGTANGGSGPEDSKSRRPVWVSIGREIDNPNGQPITFDAPKQFYDNGGESRPYAGSLALYGSFFEYGGSYYWWYPDAMRFLLGKIVPDNITNSPSL